MTLVIQKSLCRRKRDFFESIALDKTHRDEHLPHKPDDWVRIRHCAFIVLVISRPVHALRQRTPHCVRSDAGYNHLVRKSSNLTDDSGRGSQSDHLNGGATDGLALPNMVPEHLSVPRPASNVSASGIDAQLRSGSSQGNTPTPDNPPKPSISPELRIEPELKTKHAPKITYSHSEDKLMTQEGSRPIIPALPYSPYNSPHGSPRLRRYEIQVFICWGDK